MDQGKVYEFKPLNLVKKKKKEKGICANQLGINICYNNFFFFPYK
jgi:hypothetical protein